MLQERGAIDAVGHPRYRGDIDGLRAIAVTSVVLFHAGVGGISGGFVGVDVFFVISGYLIGAIVFAEVSRGTFSFARFYARRARRILPALLFLTGVLWAIALIGFTPSELADFAASAGASTLGVSNILFWKRVSYFTPDAHLDPFLMTWSLGVEEQFYLVLPLVLLLIHRTVPRHALTLVMLGSTSSLILSVLLTQRAPSAAFYLLPTRAWELGAGVALAILRHQKAPLEKGWAVEALALAGLVAIGVAVTGFDEETAFPGIAAVLPVAGCVALIAAERSVINQRLLSSTPARGIGLVSYSWYLWHWPMLALLRIGYASPPPQGLKLAAAGLSLFLAVLSWRYIERPFRKGNDAATRTLLKAGAVMAASVGGATMVIAYDGLPRRVIPQVAAIPLSVADQVGGECLAPYGVAVPRRSAACGDGVANVRMALLGDSHAAAFASTLKAVGSDHRVGLMIRTKSSCPFLLGLARRMKDRPGHVRDCISYNKSVFDDLVARSDIRLVFLTAHWIAVTDSNLADRKSRGVVEPSFKLLSYYLADTVQRLEAHHKQVIVIGSTPEFTFNPLLRADAIQIPARQWAMAILHPALKGADKQVGGPYVERYDKLNAVLARTLATDRAALFLNPGHALCSGASCRFIDQDGMPLYLDSNHLSGRGSARVSRHFNLSGLVSPLAQ